jgi:hypothetical protein
MRRVLLTALGWILLLAGVAAIVLPGPGLLLILAGLVVLSREYEWARRRVAPVRRQAFVVARAGVSSWHRIVLSLLGVVSLFAAGCIWWADPTIPRIWIFGPTLPAGGWATALGLFASGAVALGLVVYSVVVFRIRGREIADPSGATSGAAKMS